MLIEVKRRGTPWTCLSVALKILGALKRDGVRCDFGVNDAPWEEFDESYTMTVIVYREYDMVTSDELMREFAREEEMVSPEMQPLWRELGRLPARVRVVLRQRGNS